MKANKTVPDLATPIGVRMRQARRSAKLTQQDVASEFLCSRQAISSWESGKTLPPLLEFIKLASLYGVSSDSLLFGIDDVGAECGRIVSRTMEVRHG